MRDGFDGATSSVRATRFSSTSTPGFDQVAPLSMLCQTWFKNKLARFEFDTSATACAGLAASVDTSMTNLLLSGAANDQSHPWSVDTLSPSKRPAKSVPFC